MEKKSVEISVEVTFLRELAQNEENSFLQSFLQVLEPNIVHMSGGISADSFNVVIDASESKLEKEVIAKIISNYLDGHREIIATRSIF